MIAPDIADVNNQPNQSYNVTVRNLTEVAYMQIYNSLRIEAKNISEISQSLVKRARTTLKLLLNTPLCIFRQAKR